jgi:hypothetical protein
VFFYIGHEKTQINIFFNPCLWIGKKSEVVIFGIVFGMVQGWPYEKFQKIPQYTDFDYLSLELLIIGISEACVIGPSVN